MAEHLKQPPSDFVEELPEKSTKIPLQKESAREVFQEFSEKVPESRIPELYLITISEGTHRDDSVEELLMELVEDFLKKFMEIFLKQSMKDFLKRF